MNCPNCQAENVPDARFCMSCGTKLAVVCSNCATQNPGNARFCSNCGYALAAGVIPPAPPPSVLQPAPPSASMPQPASTPQPAPAQQPFAPYMPPEYRAKMEAVRSGRRMEGQRRVVTILFCDVQGSTAMAEGLDPEEWAEIMNGAFEHLVSPVYRYEGTVARLMGDGILAFFGAPIMHEDHPWRAVLAGLDIIKRVAAYRRRLRPDLGSSFNVRVGIHTGFVVVDRVGYDLSVEYTAMGDAVNLAARMEQTAQPGAVQISAGTYRWVRDLFEVVSLGPIEVKGKAEPVEAYQVLSVREGAVPMRGVEGLHSELVGRDRELEALRQAVVKVEADHGGVVSVMGDAGLGKSRLVRDLRESSSGDVRWLEGRSFSYETAIPYTPFKAMLRPCFDLESARNDGERYVRVRTRVAALMPEKVLDVAPYIASMLGIDVPGEDGEMVRHLEPPMLRGRVFGAVSAFLARLSAERPLMLLVEDLHWADGTSLDLMEALLPLTEQAPILLLALFRPQQEEPSWRFHQAALATGRYAPIVLRPLEESDARQLVANLLHVEDLPEPVRALILRKAEGNPFFVEEVIRSLLDAGLIVEDDGHWRAVREIVNVQVPDTLAGVITARLDRLEDEQRRVAEAASVVGREFARPILNGVYDFPECIDEALDGLEQRELVLARSEALYAFRHVITHETVYGSILLSRRRELHRRVASCLERVAPDRAEEIAWHFLEGREEVRALPYIVEAGDRAKRAYAADTALEWFRRAVQLLDVMDQDGQPEDPALVRRAYEGLGKAQELKYDMAGAMQTYQRMEEIGEASGDDPMVVSSLNKRAALLLFSAQLEGVTPLLDRAEDLGRNARDARGLVELATIRCSACLPPAKFDEAVASLGSSTDMARQLGLKAELVGSLVHQAQTYTYMTRFDEAWAVAQEGLRIAEELGDLEKVAELLVYTVPFHYVVQGDLTRAEEAAQKGAELARRIGLVLYDAIAGYSLGGIALATGHYEAALRNYHEGADTFLMMGRYGDVFAPTGFSGIVSAYLPFGPEVYERETAEYAQRVEQAMFPGASAWADLGFYYLEHGDLYRAEESFQKGLTIPSAFWLVERPRLLVGSAFVSLSRGDLDGAAQRIAEARAYSEERGMAYMLPVITFAEASCALAAGDAGRSLERFQAAEDQAASMGMRPILWQVRAGAAQALIVAGRHDEAEQKREAAQRTIDETAADLEDEEMRTHFIENAMGKVGMHG